LANGLAIHIPYFIRI